MYSYCRHFILFKLFECVLFLVQTGCKKCIIIIIIMKMEKRVFSFVRKAVAQLTYICSK